MRRCVTVPCYLALWLAVLALTPLAILPALAFDVVRRSRFALCRGLAMANLYLFCEAGAIFATGYTWLTHRKRDDAWLATHYRLQHWWTGTQYNAARRIYGMKVRIEGEDAILPGPVLLFVRHVSVVDNLVAAVVVAARHGMRMRWVLNASLLRDPALDIVGHRIPNRFVRGSSNDSEAEIAKVRALAANRAPGDGMVNYPEGALFTQARRSRLIARLHERGDHELAAKAESLRNVLPPRLGGALALLDACEGMDALFCAHTGLEPVNSLTSMADGRLIGATLSIAFLRVPAAEIPRSDEARGEWLFEQWAWIDSWITSRTMQVAGK